MKKLKDIFSKDALEKTAHAIKQEYPEFHSQIFVDKTWKTIRSLELKDRVREIARSLFTFLPQDFPQSVEILQQALKSEKNPNGVEGFLAWPFLQFVEDYGTKDFEAALNAIRTMTPIMSGEFAIRPFLLQFPEKTLAVLRSWATDENHHVRRLVSEGSRPLLPWGQQLPQLKMNPELSFDLLRQLKMSKELYVRKSIANHLNDISKNHPEKLLKELARWRNEDPTNENLEWIFRHALRTLLKKGHQPSLQFLGYRGSLAKMKSFRLSPNRLQLGETLKMEAKLKIEKSGSLMVDYAVHHKKANGKHVPKVFKWKKIQVKKGEEHSLEKNHPIKRITTRVYYSGSQYIEIFCNGISVGKAEFFLKVK